MGNPIVSLAADKVGRKTNAALGRANGTIRKSNVRLADLKAFSPTVEQMTRTSEYK